jgi:hypothetical protein
VSEKKSRLAAAIDGVFLPDEEARALWEAFSAHMEANPGDAAGFAKSRGYLSCAPEYQKGRAVLVVRASAKPAKKPQR